MTGSSELYSLVPKDRAENLAYRAELLAKCAVDLDFRGSIWRACQLDVLFYINSFLFTSYPDTQEPVMPFVTWEFQDEFILGLKASFGKEDVFCCKSRKMGVSYCALAAMDHSWRFFPDQRFLVGSWKEDWVDIRDNPSTLFGKLDEFERYLPKWMSPDPEGKNRIKLLKTNPENRSFIQGESTNPNFARSGRYLAILKDEHASMPDAEQIESATGQSSPCRIYASTPKGTTNVFYQKHVSPHGKKFYFHWTRHPDFAKGLYYDSNGKPRSPWYDEECKRTHPKIVAQELDMDFLGSQYQYFEQTVLDRILGDDVREPFSVGRLSADEGAHRIDFIDVHKGELLLWLNLETGRPPTELVYGMGVDVAAGSIDKDGRGASLSCASVGNLNTGEKYAELAVSGVMPHDFAKMVFALGRWFAGQSGGSGCLVAWEANGPGQVFGRTLWDLGYRNVYYRLAQQKKVGDDTPSETPGWWSTKDSKRDLLDCYQRDLKGGLFLNRSRHAVEDCKLYVFDPAGGVLHAVAASTDDPTGTRDNHADRVIADALLNHIMRRRQTDVKTVRKYEPGTIGYRWEQRMNAKQGARYWI